jgi:hypothetical protein
MVEHRTIPHTHVTQPFLRAVIRIPPRLFTNSGLNEQEGTPKASHHIAFYNSCAISTQTVVEFNTRNRTNRGWIGSSGERGFQRSRQRRKGGSTLANFSRVVGFTQHRRLKSIAQLQLMIVYLRKQIEILTHTSSKPWLKPSDRFFFSILTAYRSRWQDGHVERLIGRIRRERLDRLMIACETYLREGIHPLLQYSMDSPGDQQGLTRTETGPGRRADRQRGCRERAASLLFQKRRVRNTQQSIAHLLLSWAEGNPFPLWVTCNTSARISAHYPLL